jgi:antitoxin component YwqK of YwqJK toxin-antitoxin module
MWKDDKRDGLGKEYDHKIYGKLIYEGEWKDGKRDGLGKEYRDRKLIYDGEWKDGQWDG